MSKVELRDVTMEFVNSDHAFLALDKINLTVEEGQFVCIIGPSGCGKSTLISLLAGLHSPTAGEILIDGEPIRGTGTDRGMVFQHYSLFPWLTARNNVSFGIQQARVCSGKQEIHDRAASFLGQVGLSEYQDKYPYELSGGMQQRVAIARTLAMDTDILLMDEPFGAIDPKNRAVLQQLTIQLCKHTSPRKSVVFVTHDIDEAIILADKIVFMEPKHIKEEILIALPKDVAQQELIRTPEYAEIRAKLMSLFYQGVVENIGGDEVVL